MPSNVLVNPNYNPNHIASVHPPNVQAPSTSAQVIWRENNEKLPGCKKESKIHILQLLQTSDNPPAYQEVAGTGSNCHRFWFVIKQSYWFLSHSFPFSIIVFVFRDISNNKIRENVGFFPSQQFSAFLWIFLHFSVFLYISLHFSEILHLRTIWRSVPPFLISNMSLVDRITL